MTEQQQKMLADFGNAIGMAATPFVEPIKQMAMDELLALKQAINEKDLDAAWKLVHEKMTGEELAAEKVELRKLVEAMADKNAARRQAANDLAWAVLKAAISVALSAALL